jgi:hypothetical protein
VKSQGLMLFGIRYIASLKDLNTFTSRLDHSTPRSGLNPYGEATGRDKILASRVSEIAFRVHEQWEGLVPEPDTLAVNTPSNPYKSEPIPLRKVEH